MPFTIEETRNELHQLQQHPIGAAVCPTELHEKRKRIIHPKVSEADLRHT